MKALQDRQQGLRTRLRNNPREINRLMSDYEKFGATVVTGDQVPGMKEWLVNERPRRRGFPFTTKSLQLFLSTEITIYDIPVSSSLNGVSSHNLSCNDWIINSLWASDPKAVSNDTIPTLPQPLNQRKR